MTPETPERILELIHDSEAARMLGTTKGEVRNLADRKRLRYRRTNIGLLFERLEIERYAERRAVEI